MITLKLADGSTLHDVRDNDRQVIGYISDAKNAVGTLDFDIYPKHHAYNDIKAGSTKIRAYRDGIWTHDYTVESVTNDLQLKKHVTATDELQYLERIEVPSYKTGVDGVPQTVSGFFMWLIEYYNARSGGERFAFGHIEGDIIDHTTTLDRSSDSPSTVASIVKDKIIDSLGGYVRVRRVDGVLTIDLKADAAGVCHQYIEFGENLVDYADEQDASELYTAVTAESKYKDDNGDEVTITLADAPDGDYLAGYVKHGDTVTNTAAATTYGVRRKHLSFDGIKNVYTLIDNCESYIAAHCEPVTTVNVSAADLSTLDSNVQSFDVGLYTRVKAAPMGFDAAFECQGAKRSLNDPTDDKYTLGWTWGSLSSINNRKSVETALGIGKLEQASAEIDQTAKDAAQQATVANAAAIVAKDTADAKRRVFYSQPLPPYDKGDLWSQGTGGDMLICSTPKTDGMSYLASDWDKATKYTDDTKAIEAEGLAQEAAKTATDYIDFGADGLIVGDMTDGALSGNVRIASDGVELRDGTSVLARLKADMLELAANSVNAIIKLCGGKGSISYKTVSEDTMTDDSGLCFVSEKVSILSNGKALLRSTQGSWSTEGSGVATAFVEARSTEGSGASVVIYAGLDTGAHTAHSSYSSRLLIDESSVYIGKPDPYVAGQTNWRSVVTSIDPVYGGRVIYDNASGSNGTIALSESVANFAMIEIYYKSNDGENCSVKVADPNGKVVNMAVTHPEGGSNGAVYWKSRSVVVSGGSIASDGTRYTQLGMWNGNNVVGSLVNLVYITKVIGYR